MPKCNGIVINQLAGIASMIVYEHEDRQCARPGPRDLPLGAFIESEWEIRGGICEHEIVAIHEIAPEPSQSQPVTVESIVQNAEQRQQPKVTVFKDEPASQQIIERAKIAPRIKSDFASAPAAARAAMSSVTQAVIEHRLDFDGDLSEYTAEELAELRGSRTEVEPISDGRRPMNPFDSSFDLERLAPPQEPQVRRRGNKPISVFDR